MRLKHPRLVALAVSFALCRAALAADIPEPAARRPGLTLWTFDVEPESLRGLKYLVAGQTPNVSRYIDDVDLDNNDFGESKEWFIAEANGFLQVDVAGEYAFELASDDGSKLTLDAAEVVDNDGLHDAKMGAVGKATLAAGPHAIGLRMFNGGKDRRLVLRWKPPGASDFTVVPTSAFFTQANVVHVTSPGLKKAIEPLANTRPGDGQPEVDVHPSFKLSDIHHDGFDPKIGGIDFLPDGRLVCSTWDPQGDVFLVDTKTHEAKRFATGLAEPLGVKVVDGRIFVLQKQELTELIDRDGDGVCDEYRCVSNRWPVSGNFHEFAFGLAYKDGFFYATLAVAIDPGGHTTKPQLSPDPKTGVGRGQCVRIDAKTGEVTSVAQGLRAPNGINVMPSTGDLYIIDNQGDWLPSSKLIRVVPGAFYGEHLVPPAPLDAKPVTPPVVWLPQGEIGNSPSQPVECTVGPWKGQILHGDVTHGGIKRTFVETVGDVTQGCVFRFSQGLNAGVSRLAWGPDGALYIGEIGSTGNWGQLGKEKFGLQRLEYTGAPSFEMLAVRAKSNGFEIEFTQPLAESVGDEPTHYGVSSWRYEPADTYGGPKIDERPVAVKSATVSADRKRVFLQIDDLAADRVVYFRLADVLRDAAGERLWTTEAWYTLNAIPRDRAGEVGPAVARNMLSEAERAAGWSLLFDGKSLDGWKGWQKDERPAGWKVVDGEIRRGDGGGDLVSGKEYGDFELSVDWKISRGGNSGIIWRASETESPSWHTGPEMQILDNRVHPDGRSPLTSAGAAYALIPPSRDAALAPDRWNTARLIVRGTKVEQFLNNERVVAFDMGSDEWKALVAKSKFKGYANFAKMPRGRIVLQDHNDQVSYRNVKIRELK